MSTVKLFKHPESLSVFFTTEMWERYGFYVIQTLLALFLLNHFHWHDNHVYIMTGTFTALTYLSPVVGGYIADHFLGQKKAVLFGGFVLLISYLMLTIAHTPKTIEAVLASIAVGTGLLKPNISSLLGNQYPQQSPLRESGFTIFYMGLTLGIILGTTLPSHIQANFGWDATFFSAAIGLLIGIISFYFGMIRYNIQDYTIQSTSFKHIVSALVLVIGLWFASFIILMIPVIADWAFLLTVLLSIIFIIYSSKYQEPEQQKRTRVIGLLCLTSTIFWAFYFQMFLSLTLFISRVVQPSLWGIPFPPPFYVTVQSIGMIILGYFLSRFVSQKAISLNLKGQQISRKFFIALILMSVAYACIVFACHTHINSGKLSPLYFIPTYLLISLAELLLSPVGLSAITLLSSPSKVSTMMGIFFISLAVGAYLAGKLAQITSVPNIALMSISDLQQHYAHGFTIIFILTLGAIFISFIINRVIYRLLEN